MLKRFCSGILLCIAILPFVFVSCVNKENPVNEDRSLTEYVDPFIGTGGHGHVFLGANVPFGLVQLGPTNITGGWDWVSGYHYSDSTIFGFSHMHLSGTGIGDLLDILVMPVTGNPKLAKGIAEDPNSGYYSLFRHETEKVKPGYYSVHLDRYGIEAELTTTSRVGFHKYTFPESDSSAIIINLADRINWDTPVEGYFIRENDSIISGYRYSKGWAKDQKVFFTAVFSKPFENIELYEDSIMVNNESVKAQRVYAKANFNTRDREKIYVKVALSPVSIDNAKLNLKAELSGWDFDKTVKDADDVWNKELNKIQIEVKDPEIKKVFYTSLYHTMIAPSEFCDVNNDYRGADAQMHSGASFKNYTTFSLWDTYRAAHPLMTIIHPEKMSDIINTMLAIYKQQGKLPVWHLMGCETDCMVGNPGIPVVADAYLKGFDGFDKNVAYEAMKNSALMNDRGLDYYKELGFVPYDKEFESVAKGLEYALADWSLAQVAKERGEKEDYDYFLNRSNSFNRYFDESVGFMRAIDSNGNFRKEEFNPFISFHREDDYTEGNAWQYVWLVPQNVKGLVDLFGSEEKFVEKLDSLFIVEGDLGEHASPDIDGLIGQYAHGNEPSHHVLYLYPYVGQPYKTAEKVREVLATMYFDEPNGITGNEDVGQMSAWYILSALGFYQVAPAGGVYVFGSPIVDKADIHVGNNKVFKIKTINNSADNKYIDKVTLNGKSYSKSYIDYKDIVSGGEIIFEMSNVPSDKFGVEDKDRPQTIQ